MCDEDTRDCATRSQTHIGFLSLSLVTEPPVDAGGESELHAEGAERAHQAEPEQVHSPEGRAIDMERLVLTLEKSLWRANVLPIAGAPRLCRSLAPTELKKQPKMKARLDEKGRARVHARVIESYQGEFPPPTSGDGSVRAGGGWIHLLHSVRGRWHGRMCAGKAVVPVAVACAHVCNLQGPGVARKAKMHYL